MGVKQSQRDALLSIAAANLMMPGEQDRKLARSPEANQIRAARALLNWSGRDLANASGLTVAMIGKIEAGTVRPSPKVMGVLREAFNAASAILIAPSQGSDEGPGVRLRKAGANE